MSGQQPALSEGTSTQKSGGRYLNNIFRRPKWKQPSSIEDLNEKHPESGNIDKWSMGILNDRLTEEVPGTVLLLSSNRNEPLGLHHQPERTSASSLPSPYPPSTRRSSMHLAAAQKKKTPDGQFLLDPQPDDSLNDPLNWPVWRRDLALLSLGFYCMLGGGMTPILAAGFSNVSKSFGVPYARVALTTGLYMMGLGIGSVIFSPTAILFGKRPVYLFSAIMFMATSIWCAVAPNYANLATARVFQGISVSPVECLPSATIAEIFFLHERAFRIGIYTLLLLGGKNLIPLVSAAIIQGMSWRWTFYLVSIVVGFCGVMLFLFVPETFWDRTPRPKSHRRSRSRSRSPSTRRPTAVRKLSDFVEHTPHRQKSQTDLAEARDELAEIEKVMTPRQQKLHDENVHARFLDPEPEKNLQEVPKLAKLEGGEDGPSDRKGPLRLMKMPPAHLHLSTTQNVNAVPEPPHLHNLNSPYYADLERNDDYLSHHVAPEQPHLGINTKLQNVPLDGDHTKEEVKSPASPISDTGDRPKIFRYTTELRQSPPKSWSQTLKPWNGRLTKAPWLKVAFRPFVLYAYPAVLWSALMYSLSIGWLIVLSESVSSVYRNRDTYNFSALGVGLVYLSPFIGGVLGTAVAGKVSDIIVQYMSRRNGGVYEPEFRLVMAIPVAIATSIGLMGFGWSAQERDRWIVPTVFFGVISFGCSLGSTTAITFCVDSYRQYAGEALVTLNFSKNIFHGLVFSLFFASWLEDDGPKKVFLSIGGIQIACLITTVPMYIYGKRARMMTVRKKWMERF
jgi:MFS family permease